MYYHPAHTIVDSPEMNMLYFILQAQADAGS